MGVRIDNPLLFLYCEAKSGGGQILKNFWVELKPILKTNRLFVFLSVALDI